MKELLETFSISQIILFIVLLAIAIKKVSDFVDWKKLKLDSRDKKQIERYNKEKEMNERFDELETSVKSIADNMNTITNNMNNLNDKVNILMESDKDDIKAWITREHHYFCYQKGWIDDYSLDCLERRYEHYKEEHGNSFIGELVNEVRNLPKQDPSEMQTPDNT